ncbi:hypothetical protein EHQ12_09395 [Leptospira gomenensis]|uniref:Uncharacterized protein n=1 Tax=Leptospira gomenensis TaxID=2484974 RepID=A0A5F1Z0R4_9LEPT|nr:tetratricopeptide repeat protein [Leptospira gomenensis]TGK33383.1 hypothetical protein EHQ17_11375 [Leptospira gomenensis]TGK39335.1 hypothetical protein EHQ12_09395 [Leptospira gomenensis]TGK40511.1 hypothetical protein EHQ07_18140 [Leptospira gomenensis]TGK67439.1 hypothetical protein EHQ13_01980 [Leptospira gomenensis]
MNSKKNFLSSLFRFPIRTFFLLAILIHCNKKDTVSVLEVRDLTEKDNLVEALQKAEEELKRKGNTGELLYIRGWIRYLQKNQKAAKDDFLLCLQLNPDSMDCKRGLGLVYEADKDYDKAETAYREALTISAKHGLDAQAVLRENLGNLFLRQNRRKEAAEEFRTSVSLSDKGDAYYGSTLCMMMEGDTEGAIASLEKGVTKTFRGKALKSESHFLLAKFYYEKRKDPIKAEIEIKKAIEIFPLHKEYLDALRTYTKERIQSGL